MPGSIRLKENNILKDIVLNHYTNYSCLIGAICAAPAVVLNNYGLLQGKTVTCYPAPQFRGYFNKLNILILLVIQFILDALHNSSVTVSNDRVVVDKNIITSQGPGTALEFSLTLVELLYGKSAADLLSDQMVHQRRVNNKETNQRNN